MFRIQVFSTDVDQAVVDEALSITHNQSRKVRGLSLSIRTSHF
jgi:chemotaxis methyl-accepting protein methylase